MGQLVQSALASAAAAIGADTATLGAGTDLVVHLAVAPFTPGPNLTLGDLTEATFTGYGSLGSSSIATVGRDPATGAYVITLPDPAGGWRFKATATVSPPQTASGWYVVNSDSGALVMADLLPTPITLTGAGDEVILGTVNASLVPGFIQ